MKLFYIVVGHCCKEIFERRKEGAGVSEGVDCEQWRHKHCVNRSGRLHWAECLESIWRKDLQACRNSALRQPLGEAVCKYVEVEHRRRMGVIDCALEHIFKWSHTIPHILQPEQASELSQKSTHTVISTHHSFPNPDDTPIASYKYMSNRKSRPWPI